MFIRFAEACVTLNTDYVSRIINKPGGVIRFFIVEGGPAAETWAVKFESAQAADRALGSIAMARRLGHGHINIAADGSFVPLTEVYSGQVGAGGEELIWEPTLSAPMG